MTPKRIFIAGLALGISTGIMQCCGCGAVKRERVIVHDIPAAPQTTFDCTESYSSECQDLLRAVVVRQHV